ncbi:arginine biosynthesis bifunctional protein ArgJ, chloroplastic-like [Dendrobium catenatum]|uniref:arginine biosynthesis bifunctional protein ArgJ, chloroplastic-like n=1 Tax=Dendrobium catenatum TaxID=906689 RepID=UPI00109EEA5A|nr:arginine biosynthesis bifunctional protein ArgJ, chloroplastic-like [Dendrobium catenatum]
MNITGFFYIFVAFNDSHPLATFSSLQFHLSYFHGGEYFASLLSGVFTKNIVAAAPVIYCRNVLKNSNTARAILINAGQANAATGNPGYQDAVECAHSVAQFLQVRQEDVMIQSTGVIGQRIKKTHGLTRMNTHASPYLIWLGSR